MSISKSCVISCVIATSIEDADYASSTLALSSNSALFFNLASSPAALTSFNSSWLRISSALADPNVFS